MKELGEKTGVRVGLDLQWVWELKQESDLPQLSDSEEKHLRLRVKHLICGSLNGMRIRQSLLQPYIPQIGTLVPWKAQRLRAGR